MAPTKVRLGARTLESIINARTKREVKEERVEQLEAKLFDLALNADRQETQVMAATRLHAIYEGQPIARTITANVDDLSQLSDDQIRAEIARLAGGSISDGGGDTPPGLSQKPAGLVH